MPLPVTFTESSTGAITTRQWDFGDTATSTDQNPTHTYDAPGTYTASLTVTGTGGSDTETQQIVVNGRPLVNITAPQDGTTFVPDDQVAFTGTASDFEDGDLSAGIAWTSSIDGALDTGASIAGTLSSGTHTITASVTDSGGATANTSITVAINAPPVVNVTAPEDGAGFVPDDQVTFTGTASDLEDVDLSDGITWTSSIDGPLGTGASIPSTLSSGTHTITATVTDAGGKTASDQIMVTVNAAPTVLITAPQEDGTTVQSGDIVTFAGSAQDLEDGDVSGAIEWASDVDGSLGTGASISPSTLSSGLHTITASVTDTGGKSATTSITLTVNAPPVVSITAPQDGTTRPFGSPVTLTAIATDPEDGDLSGGLAWTSSLDGSLPSGASISPSTLTIGTHTITASVTDTDGKAASDSITITVANNPPVVVINAPANNASFSAVATVNFAGTATDVEDGSLTPNIAWTSNRDGSIGTGGSFSTSSLSVGVHTITASVTDSGGKTASASITITITAITPPTGPPPTLPDPGCRGRCEPPPREQPPGEGPPGGIPGE